MNWLWTILLDWAWSRISRAVGGFFSWLGELWARHKIGKRNSANARSLEAIAAEVRQLESAGLPVPETLKEEMRAAASRLINDARPSGS